MGETRSLRTRVLWIWNPLTPPQINSGSLQSIILSIDKLCSSIDKVRISSNVLTIHDMIWFWHLSNTKQFLTNIMLFVLLDKFSSRINYSPNGLQPLFYLLMVSFIINFFLLPIRIFTKTSSSTFRPKKLTFCSKSCSTKKLEIYLSQVIQDKSFFTGLK